MRVRMKVRACWKALGEKDGFGEVASPSAGKVKQRQQSTRHPGRKLGWEKKEINVQRKQASPGPRGPHGLICN